MDGVTAIAEILRREGVDFIGCVPYQPLLEAAAIAGIRPIIFRQEGTGIHMVDGYSRVTNGHRIGVFMMQNGPGAENGFGGVAQAYAESVPILLLPAGMARQRRGVHPNFYPTRSYESITKWCAEINLVERVPELMRRAFAKLRSGRPGPVLLEIPQDVALAEFREEWL
jgi:acetolactate synthase-1/2/3 large subunit